MQAVFLLALVVAFATLCKCQTEIFTQCRVNADCIQNCLNSAGVCRPPTSAIPWRHCRCHTFAKRFVSFGGIDCSSDADCKGPCGNPNACCHIDHCHCNGDCHDHRR